MKHIPETYAVIVKNVFLMPAYNVFNSVFLFAESEQIKATLSRGLDPHLQSKIDGFK